MTEVPPLESYMDVIQPSSELSVSDGVCAYINAGGRGTRLNAVFTPDEKTGITKALLRFDKGGETLIQRHIDALLTSGFDDIIVGVGDHHHVKQYIETTYDDAYVHAIDYDDQLGNGGDMLRAVQDYSELFTDSIYVANVDTFINIDKRAVAERHRQNGADMTFVLTMSEGVPNYQAFYVDENDRILHTNEDARAILSDETRENTHYRGSSTGSMMLAKTALQAYEWKPSDGAIGLYREVVGDIIAKGRAYAYNNGHRPFIDIGTEDTWRRVNDPQFTLEQQ